MFDATYLVATCFADAKVAIVPIGTGATPEKNKYAPCT